MKKFSISVALLIILTILFAGSEMAYAQTQMLTRDFGETAIVNSAGTNVFAYDVSQTAQCEPNGGWIWGNTYQVNWTVRLDYVNEDCINGSSYILFYLPTPTDTDSNVMTQFITNQTQLSLSQKTGILSATFTPQNGTGYGYSLNLPFAVYINSVNATDNLRPYTSQDVGFSTDLLNNAHTSEVVQTPEFPSLFLIIALFAAVSVALLFVVRIRKPLSKV